MAAPLPRTASCECCCGGRGEGVLMEPWGSMWCTVSSPLPFSRSSSCLCVPTHRYHVSRDTLFSYHSASEEFLHRLMALYVSSHYKNTPNDLQLLSDAPAHQVFVLVPPVLPSSTTLPDILCVLQVSQWLGEERGGCLNAVLWRSCSSN